AHGRRQDDPRRLRRRLHLGRRVYDVGVRRSARIAKWGGLAPQARNPPFGHGGLRRFAANSPYELLPLRDRRVSAPRRAGIELARAAEFLVRILDHFLPL